VCKKHVDKKIYKFSLACRQIEAHTLIPDSEWHVYGHKVPSNPVSSRPPTAESRQDHQPAANASRPRKHRARLAALRFVDLVLLAALFANERLNQTLEELSSSGKLASD
jgi:hypothetical protein